MYIITFKISMKGTYIHGAVIPGLCFDTYNEALDYLFSRRFQAPDKSWLRSEWVVSDGWSITWYLETESGIIGVKFEITEINEKKLPECWR